MFYPKKVRGCFTIQRHEKHCCPKENIYLLNFGDTDSHGLPLSCFIWPQSVTKNNMHRAICMSMCSQVMWKGTREERGHSLSVSSDTVMVALVDVCRTSSAKASTEPAHAHTHKSFTWIILLGWTQRLHIFGHGLELFRYLSGSWVEDLLTLLLNSSASCRLRIWTLDEYSGWDRAHISRGLTVTWNQWKHVKTTCHMTTLEQRRIAAVSALILIGGCKVCLKWGIPIASLFKSGKHDDRQTIRFLQIPFSDKPTWSLRILQWS